MPRKALLIVDRNPEIRSLLRAALGQRFSVDVVATIVEATAESRHPRHTGFVVDIGASADEELTFLRGLRASGDNRVVVTISAHRSRDLPALCYEAGADGHIDKTGALIRELRALLPRLLQRAGGCADGHRRTDGILLPRETFRFAGAAIDPKTMRATFGGTGHSVDLNPKEIGILHLFARRQGHLVRRSEILAHVWGPHATPTSKSLDTYLVRLRSHYRKQGIDLGRVLRSKPKVGWWVLGGANQGLRGRLSGDMGETPMPPATAGKRGTGVSPVGLRVLSSPDLRPMLGEES